MCLTVLDAGRVPPATSVTLSQPDMLQSRKWYLIKATYSQARLCCSLVIFSALCLKGVGLSGFCNSVKALQTESQGQIFCREASLVSESLVVAAQHPTQI